MALVPAASAQDDSGTDPDLASGWVLRASVNTGEPLLSELSEVDWPGALAGTPSLGFVVIDDEDGLYSRDGITWQPVSLEEPAEAIRINDVAAGPRGFVAVGEALTGDPAYVWHSPDGRTWIGSTPTIFRRRTPIRLALGRRAELDRIVGHQTLVVRPARQGSVSASR